MPIRRFAFFILPTFLVACQSTPKKYFASPETPCFKAVIQNDVETLNTILSECKISKTKNGTTPLMLASAKGHHLIVNALLQAGFDVNEQDNTYETALGYAVVRNQVEVTQFLILNGAKVTSTRPDGITILMRTVQQGRYPMIRVLLQDPEVVNAQAEDGWTAMHFAVRRKNPHILKLLLDQRACKDLVDNYGQTPVDFAHELGWVEGLEIMKNVKPCKGKS